MHHYINASVCCHILAAAAAYYKQGAFIPDATCAPIGTIFSWVPFSIALHASHFCQSIFLRVRIVQLQSNILLLYGRPLLCSNSYLLGQNML
jgi:hypothetical protein